MPQQKCRQGVPRASHCDQLTVWGSYPLPRVLLKINSLATVNSREQAKQRTYKQIQSNKGVAGRTSIMMSAPAWECRPVCSSLAIDTLCARDRVT